jgi:hypothetical protein
LRRRFQKRYPRALRILSDSNNSPAQTFCGSRRASWATWFEFTNLLPAEFGRRLTVRDSKITALRIQLAPIQHARWTSVCSPKTAPTIAVFPNFHPPAVLFLPVLSCIGLVCSISQPRRSSSPGHRKHIIPAHPGERLSATDFKQRAGFEKARVLPYGHAA